MLTFLRDIRNLLQQIIPNPITLFCRYQFSPSDLVFKRLPPPVQQTSSSDGKRRQDDGATSTSVHTTFDVLSYNINHEASTSPIRRQQILRAIFTSGADVVLLQETNAAWEQLLKDDAVALQYNNCYYHHPRPGDRPAGGIAVLSKFPLKNIDVVDTTRDIDGSVFPALVCGVSVPILDGDCKSQTTTNRKERYASIHIANVHLRPPVNLDGSAWLDTARKTEPTREAEIKELIRRTTVALDIIAGDFNEGDNGAALRYLVSQGFTDALQKYVPCRKETHTWSLNWLTLYKRLDHILWSELSAITISPQEDDCKTSLLKCVGCGVISGYENGASDHQPVLSRFAIVDR